jgi:hypothetical protein
MTPADQPRDWNLCPDNETDPYCRGFNGLCCRKGFSFVDRKSAEYVRFSARPILFVNVLITGTLSATPGVIRAFLCPVLEIRLDVSCVKY